MIKTCRLLFSLLMVLTAHSIFSQTPEDVIKVQLSLGDGKTVYRMGEPIRLILSFTSTKSGYKVEQLSYQQDEQIILSPIDGTYNWHYRYPHPSELFDDVSHSEPLSAEPKTVEKLLNDFTGFDKPGKYSLKVITKRVFEPKESNNWGTPIPLVTNSVDFEIKEMSDKEEQEEVKRLSALLSSTQDYYVKNNLAHEFSFLNGDVSTVEKVNRYLNASGYYDPNLKGWMRSGILMAKNRKLVIKLLEEAFRDPNREADSELIYLVTNLRLLEEEKSFAVDESDLKSYWDQIDKRSVEIEQEYKNEQLASLSIRSGISRLVTAFDIFIKLPKTDTSSEVFRLTKALILENFDELSLNGQDYLLQEFFEERIKTSEILPSIEKILASKSTMSNSLFKQDALKRLIKFDQKKARPIVISEICDPDSRMNPEVLGLLDDKTLPEIDDALLEQTKKLAAKKDRLIWFKFQLASRYATKKIFPELMEIYKSGENDWYEDEAGAILSYFVRINEKQASPLIEARILKSKQNNSEFSLFFHLTKNNFPKGLEKLFRKRLESDDPETAGGAAYYLTKYPTQENRKLIQKRYNLWLSEWSKRGAEIENPKAEAYIKKEGSLQINLLNALIRTPGWKLSDNEIYNLKISCLTQACRQNFSNYAPAKN